MFKRVLALGMATLMAVSLSSCSLLEPVLEEMDVAVLLEELLQDKEQLQYDYGKSLYVSLVNAENIGVQMAKTMYYARIFVEEDADRYPVGSRLPAFADAVGLSEAEVYNACVERYQTTDYTTLSNHLATSAGATVVIKQVYENNGTLQKLEEEMENAEKYMNVLSERFSDYSEYPALEAFYNKVSNFTSYAKSPTGKPERIKERLEGYEGDLRECREALEPTFG